VFLLMVLLLKSSAHCISDGATSSSVGGALEKALVIVDGMVAEIYAVLMNMFTKKESIREFE
jgi:hypothetical protein